MRKERTKAMSKENSKNRLPPKRCNCGNEHQCFWICCNTFPNWKSYYLTVRAKTNSLTLIGETKASNTKMMKATNANSHCGDHIYFRPHDILKLLHALLQIKAELQIYFIAKNIKNLIISVQVIQVAIISLIKKKKKNRPS